MGLTWLKYPENQWPVFKMPECKNIAGFESEVKIKDVLFEGSLLSREKLSQEVSQLVDLSNIDEPRYSSMLKFLRITAWILRFVNILKKREPFSDQITAKE